MKLSIRLTLFVIAMIAVAVTGYFIVMNYLVPWLLEQDETTISFALIGLFGFGIVVFVGIAELFAKILGCDEAKLLGCDILIDKFLNEE